MKRLNEISPLLSLSLILFLIWPYPALFSQCTNGTQPECKCSTAPVLCTIDELDGYVFSMASYLHPNDGPSPVCPGANMSQTNNPTWFAFTAWCTDLFDRWGEHMFHARNIHSNDPSIGWDGTFHNRPMLPGVFAYIVKLKFTDGTEKTMTGDVTLVR